jgi:CBF1 interacting corepressor
MPGISFLFKKRFHPMRMDNQKRLFVAEETQKSRGDKERELAEQVVKEREILSYEQLGVAPDRDARSSSLRFMYSAPLSAKGTTKKDVNRLLEPPAPAEIDEHGDDPAVREFRRKLLSVTNPQLVADEHPTGPVVFGPQPTNDLPFGNDIDQKDEDEDGKGYRNHPQSALERAVGKRQKTIVTVDQQVERHPFLKNAPVEGSYTKNMELQHKPFNELIRNVRCLRCGEWGHQTGDRECVLRNHNRNDFERQQREDPLNALRAQSQFCKDTSSMEYLQQVEVDEKSDPEAEFLKTLSRREKKLLLRKLQLMEGLAEPTVNNFNSSERSDNGKKTNKRKRKESKYNKETTKSKDKQRRRDISSDDSGDSSGSTSDSTNSDSD